MKRQQAVLGTLGSDRSLGQSIQGWLMGTFYARRREQIEKEDILAISL
jgi:hypothetical protein